MELNEHDFLEELLALGKETWDFIPTEANQLFSNGWSSDCFDQNPVFLPNSECQQVPQIYNINGFNEYYNSFLDELSPPQIIDSSHNTLDSTTSLDTPPFLAYEDYPLSMMEEEDQCFVGEELQSLEPQTICKVEPSQSPEMAVVFNVGTCLERKNRSQKLQGQPSKNLMAERRRRKRLILM